MKEKLLISSCLYGQNVRYDGKNSILSNEILEKLNEKYDLIPFCPEVEGGLNIPRIPNEIQINGKIIDKKGVENTKAFQKGAIKTLKLCQKESIRIALLKSKSPSCSNNFIYDGSFSKKLIKGNGVTSKLLKQNKIQVINEFEIISILKILERYGGQITRL